jgi:hypothetical protein
MERRSVPPPTAIPIDRKESRQGLPRALLEQSAIDRMLTSLDNDDALGVLMSRVQQDIECFGNDRRRKRWLLIRRRNT